MKTYTTILGVLFSIFWLNSAAQLVPKGTYVFTHSSPLVKCDIYGHHILDNNQYLHEVAEAGWKFRVINLKPNYINKKKKDLNGDTVEVKDTIMVYIIQISDFSDSERQEKINLYNGEQVYYILSAQRFDYLAVNSYSRWDFSGGVISVPIKFRFGKKDSLTLQSGRKIPGRDFDLVTNFNLGASMGVKLRCGKYAPDPDKSVSLLIGASVTAITADSSSTLGHHQDSNTELFGATLSMSLVLDIKKFQGVLTLGKDWLGGDIGNNWMYQHGTWFGVGIGTNLFDANPSSEKQPKPN